MTLAPTLTRWAPGVADAEAQPLESQALPSGQLPSHPGQGG